MNEIVFRTVCVLSEYAGVGLYPTEHAIYVLSESPTRAQIMMVVLLILLLSLSSGLHKVVFIH